MVPWRVVLVLSGLAGGAARPLRSQPRRAALPARPPHFQRLASAFLVTTLCAGVAQGGAEATLPPANALAAETWRVVDRGYVDRTFNGLDWFGERQKLVQATYPSTEDAYAAIRELLGKLDDRYTRFLTPAQFASIESTARGGVVGVGVELSPMPEPEVGGVRITRVFENSPAQAAGVKAGEVIRQVDLQPLLPPLTSDDIATLIRGPPKSRVVLSLAGPDGERNVDIERAAVKLTSARSYGARLADGARAQVIEVRAFSSETPKQVADAVKGAGKPEYFVLDLRGNGGGSLEGGIDVARLFLADGAKIVSVEDKSGTVRAYLAENGGALDTQTPIVALVNRDTASAAEVLAGALADNGRAVLVGERTFGKGVIQTLTKLTKGGGGGVAFTTARYRTPSGIDINKKGLSAAEPWTTEGCTDSGAGRPAEACVKASALPKPVTATEA